MRSHVNTVMFAVITGLLVYGVRPAPENRTDASVNHTVIKASTDNPFDDRHAVTSVVNTTSAALPIPDVSAALQELRDEIAALREDRQKAAVEREKLIQHIERLNTELDAMRKAKALREDPTMVGFIPHQPAIIDRKPVEVKKPEKTAGTSPDTYRGGIFRGRLGGRLFGGRVAGRCGLGGCR